MLQLGFLLALLSTLFERWPPMWHHVASRLPTRSLPIFPLPNLCFSFFSSEDRGWKCILYLVFCILAAIRNGHSASAPLGEGGKVIQRKKGLWRGEGGVNEEIETGKAED